jgi:hypothetical protein
MCNVSDILNQRLVYRQWSAYGGGGFLLPRSHVVHACAASHLRHVPFTAVRHDGVNKLADVGGPV